MIEKPDVSILIISFNTREMTIDCIRSVYAETKNVNFEIIVVDNASADGSAAAISTEFPSLKLIALDDNVGFARGNNLGSEYANADLLLLLNPDTVVLDGAIDRIVEFSRETPDAGIWGGRTLFGDRSLNPTSCWRALSPWSLLCSSLGLSALFPASPIFNAEAYGAWKRDTVRRVDMVTGCFLLIKRDLWTKLAGFDPVFYMYGEDADLCLRARQGGARPMITPEATIVHYGGKSETIRSDKLKRLLSAKVTLVNKHWTPVSRIAGQALFRLFCAFRAFGYASASRLARRSAWAEKAEIWQKVWATRAEWLRGYQEPPPDVANETRP